MTYWYETPDDQKDTWHWMGVAISLAHTIGLHRNSEKSNMDIRKKRLWKRIWWSCFMRDRLIALGMRRPTRIKDEDFDVPELTLEDFEIEPLAGDNLTIPHDCTLIRDVTMQADLAAMCIAKAKLCLIISHVLSAQYSVLVRHQGMAQGQEGNTRSSVMLFPKKLDQTDEVKRCDQELTDWIQNLEPQYQYRTPTIDDISRGGSSPIVQLALLHMVYFSTVSALHRPQVLPSSSVSSGESSTHPRPSPLQDISRSKVRTASAEITRMSLDLHHLSLTRYLPTTGVTVLLPAIIIHLLDIKSCSDETRKRALRGFCGCMLVLERLRDNYAAADYAVQFLEAAIRKADIDVGGVREMPGFTSTSNVASIGTVSPGETISNGTWGKKGTGRRLVQTVSQLVDAGRAAQLTPPPDRNHPSSADKFHFSLAEESKSLYNLSASTPPGSDSSHHGPLDAVAASLLPPSDDGGIKPVTESDTTHISSLDSHQHQHQQYPDDGFDALIDYGAGAGADPAGGDAPPDTMMLDWSGSGSASAGPGGTVQDAGFDFGMHGESGGFMMDIQDMEWMKDGGGVDLWSTAVQGGEYLCGEGSSGDVRMGMDMGMGIGVGKEENEEEAVFLLKGGG